MRQYTMVMFQYYTYSNRQMNYFENQERSFSRIINDHRNRGYANQGHSQDRSSIYGQYKLDRPKHPIVLKSIYTENQSQFIKTQSYEDDKDNDEEKREDCGNCEDIHQFIQNSKTLKQKIYEKLEKKKKPNHKPKIIETTFRPSQAHKPLKENMITNRKADRSSNKETKIQTTERASIVKNRLHTEYSEKEEKWWGQEGEVKIMDLRFHERQERTLKKKIEESEKIGIELKKREMEGCTFKPKLTKYTPRRI